MLRRATKHSSSCRSGDVSSILSSLARSCEQPWISRHVCAFSRNPRGLFRSFTNPGERRSAEQAHKATQFLSPFSRGQQPFLRPLSSLLFYQGPEVVWTPSSSWVPSQMMCWMQRLRVKCSWRFVWPLSRSKQQLRITKRLYFEHCLSQQRFPRGKQSSSRAVAHTSSQADTHTLSAGKAKHDIPARVTELQAGRERSFDPSTTMGWVMLSQQTQAESPHPTGTSLGTFSVKPL